MLFIAAGGQLGKQRLHVGFILGQFGHHGLIMGQDVLQRAFVGKKIEHGVGRGQHIELTQPTELVKRRQSPGHIGLVAGGPLFDLLILLLKRIHALGQRLQIGRQPSHFFAGRVQGLFSFVKSGDHRRLRFRIRGHFLLRLLQFATEGIGRPALGICRVNEFGGFR